MNTQALSTLTLDGFGKLPSAEFRLTPDGTIEFRYLVENGNYPGFDGHWRVMSEAERREHLRMGGRIAEWLSLVEKKGSNK